jgi:hypothetical protein
MAFVATVVPLQLLAHHTACVCARHGRGQTAEPGEECDGGIVQPVDNYDDASDQHGAANPAKLTYR